MKFSHEMTMPLFSQSEWNSCCDDVVAQMRQHVQSFVTPISKVISNEEGEHWGSGSYVEISGQRFLTTNEHVAAALSDHSLAYKFFGRERYFSLPNEVLTEGAPIDFALSKMENSIWTSFPHQAAAIPFSRFAEKHNPVEGELLFFAGFSQDRSRFSFGTLVTGGTPYLCRECTLPSDIACDSQRHFALSYNPSEARSSDGSTCRLPLPPGFSGSLVWNTRVVEQRMLGQPWAPEHAVVTGMIWAWSSETSLLATKVEYLPIKDMATHLA